MSLVSEKIPFSWFRVHLANDLLPSWYKVSVTENGFFHANLDREWNRTDDTNGTLVSQCRLIYVFSVGFEITGESKYKKALQDGANFLLDYFYDASGRMVQKIDEARRPTFIRYDSYGNVSRVSDSSGVWEKFEFAFDDAKKQSYSKITSATGRIEEV